MLVGALFIVVGSLVAYSALSFWRWAITSEFDGLAPEVGLALSILVTVTFASAAAGTSWVHGLASIIIPWGVAIAFCPRSEGDWLDRYKQWGGLTGTNQGSSDSSLY